VEPKCSPLNLSLKRNRFRAAGEKKFTRPLPVLYNFVGGTKLGRTREIADAAESDYTSVEGKPMETTDPAEPQQPKQAPDPSVERDDPSATPFERLRARLKGTVTILGDIVNSDPDLWV